MQKPLRGIRLSDTRFSEGLLGVFLMNESGGSKTVDLVSGIEASFQNSPTWNQGGILFDWADSDYLDCGQAIAPTTALTVITRVRFTDPEWVRVAGRRTNGDLGWALYRDYSNNAIVFQISTDGTTGTSVTGATNGCLLNEDLVVAATYGDGYMRAYIDGDPAGGSFPQAKNGNINVSACSFRIGGDAYNDVGGGLRIDWLYVWERRLTAEEILEITRDPFYIFRPIRSSRNIAPPRSKPVRRIPPAPPLRGRTPDLEKPVFRGLVGYWPLQQTAGVIAPDVSGRGIDGTLKNMDPVTDWAGADRGLCLDFDGTDDFIDLGDVLDPGSKDFTISYWAVVLNSGGPYRIFQKRGSGVFGSVGGFSTGGGSTSAGSFDRTWVEDSSGNYVTFDSTDYGFDDGKWHHFAFTFKNATGSLKAYLDGVYLATAGTSGGNPNGMNVTNSRNLTFGCSWDDGATQNQFFNGRLKNVMIFHRELDPAEIAFLYANPWLAFTYVKPLFSEGAPPVQPVEREYILANALAVERKVALVQAFGFPERTYVLKNALAVERDYSIRFGIRVERTWKLVNRIVAAERDIVLVNRLAEPVTRDIVLKNRIMEAVERDIVLEKQRFKDQEPVERDVTLVNVLLPDPAARIVEHAWDVTLDGPFRSRTMSRAPSGSTWTREASPTTCD